MTASTPFSICHSQSPYNLTLRSHESLSVIQQYFAKILVVWKCYKSTKILSDIIFYTLGGHKFPVLFCQN
jgi:hypothetical protein